MQKAATPKNRVNTPKTSGQGGSQDPNSAQPSQAPLNKQSADSRNKRNNRRNNTKKPASEKNVIISSGSVSTTTWDDNREGQSNIEERQNRLERDLESSDKDKLPSPNLRVLSGSRSPPNMGRLTDKFTSFVEASMARTLEGTRSPQDEEQEKLHEEYVSEYPTLDKIGVSPKNVSSKMKSVLDAYQQKLANYSTKGQDSGSAKIESLKFNTDNLKRASRKNEEPHRVDQDTTAASASSNLTTPHSEPQQPDFPSEKQISYATSHKNTMSSDYSVPENQANEPHENLLEQQVDEPPIENSEAVIEPEDIVEQPANFKVGSENEINGVSSVDYTKIEETNEKTENKSSERKLSEKSQKGSNNNIDVKNEETNQAVNVNQDSSLPQEENVQKDDVIHNSKIDDEQKNHEDAKNEMQPDNSDVVTEEPSTLKTNNDQEEQSKTFEENDSKNEHEEIQKGDSSKEEKNLNNISTEFNAADHHLNDSQAIESEAFDNSTSNEQHEAPNEVKDSEWHEVTNNYHAKNEDQKSVEENQLQEYNNDVPNIEEIQAEEEPAQERLVGEYPAEEYRPQEFNNDAPNTEEIQVEEKSVEEYQPQEYSSDAPNVEEVQVEEEPAQEHLVGEYPAEEYQPQEFNNDVPNIEEIQAEVKLAGTDYEDQNESKLTNENHKDHQIMNDDEEIRSELIHNDFHTAKPEVESPAQKVPENINAFIHEQNIESEPDQKESSQPNAEQEDKNDSHEVSHAESIENKKSDVPAITQSTNKVCSDDVVDKEELKKEINDKLHNNTQQILVVQSIHNEDPILQEEVKSNASKEAPSEVSIHEDINDAIIVTKVDSDRSKHQQLTVTLPKQHHHLVIEEKETSRSLPSPMMSKPESCVLDIVDQTPLTCSLNELDSTATRRIKSCIAHKEHRSASKKVHFKELSVGEIPSPVTIKTNIHPAPQGTVEQIPFDKLDNMTHNERFNEFEIIKEKGNSLRYRNKIEQAASTFEMAADVINPVYFKDSPHLAEQAKKQLLSVLNYASLCYYDIQRYQEASKNSAAALKIDASCIDAIYYYGKSKIKLGDPKEAARIFLTTKAITKDLENPLRNDIARELALIAKEYPSVNIQELEVVEPRNAPKTIKNDKSPKRSRKAFLYAVGGFVPVTIAMYLITKQMKMPAQRSLVTSISSGILMSAIGYLLGTD